MSHASPHRKSVVQHSLKSSSHNPRTEELAQEKAPAKVQPFTLNGNYSIFSVSSGLCLGVLPQTLGTAGSYYGEFGNYDNGNNSLITEQVCNGSTYQQWTITPSEVDSFQIVNANTSFCLTVTSGTSNYAPAVAEVACTGAQNFQISSLLNTQIQFSNSDSCLTTTDSQIGTQITQLPCNSAPVPNNQLFSLQLMPKPFQNYTIQNFGTGLCLNVPGQTTSYAIQLDEQVCNSSTTMQWQLVPTQYSSWYQYGGSSSTTNGGYQIYNVYSNLVIDDDGISNSPLSIVWQYGPWGGSNQNWLIIPFNPAQQTFQIVCFYSNLPLTGYDGVLGNSTWNQTKSNVGTLIVQDTWQGYPEQLWTLTPVA